MSAPHDRPNPGELIVAVRDFLAAEVLDQVSGSVAFHTKVALNVLAMVERELESATVDYLAHKRRLARLGCADDDDLSRRIRSGELDGRFEEVVHAIRAAVEDKVRVVNPKYVADPGGSQ